MSLESWNVVEGLYQRRRTELKERFDALLRQRSALQQMQAIAGSGSVMGGLQREVPARG